MPFSQDLTGKVEPTAKTWLSATTAQRLWYYQQIATKAERKKRIELMQAIGRYGVMSPRKHPRADGASGPVMDPHGGASRAFKLLASSATQNSCKLFWRAGGAIVSKSGTIYFTDVLGYHADGLVRGAPVRDVRLSDDSIAALRQEGESVWRKRPKQTKQTKQSKPAPAPAPAPAPKPAPTPIKLSKKGPIHVPTRLFKTILPPKGTPKPPKPVLAPKPIAPPPPLPPVPKPIPAPKPPAPPVQVIKPPPIPPGEPIPQRPADLARFADTVHAAIGAIPAGQLFGDDKAFIHHAFSLYVARHGEMAYGDFQRLLLEAHRLGLVELSRADLVEAMSALNVRLSTTLHPMGATFNFIRLRKR